jgi:hypothetical protein
MKQLQTILYTSILLVLFSELTAQQNEGGQPWSFTLMNESLGFQEVSVAAPETKRLEKIQEEAAQGYRPDAFAILVPVNKSPLNSGSQDFLEDGRTIWRLKLSLMGSQGISLYFTEFLLPEGVRLFVYSEDKKELLGAFTHTNIRESGLFATALIRSGTVVLELNIPAGINLGDWFQIREMTYAFALENNDERSKGFGTSDFCEVNINCSPEGDLWQDEKRGVARIQVRVSGVAFWCTGSLVNNTRYDNTPYLLTADHCAFKFGQYASEQDLGTWIFYFNYESPECEDPPQEPQLFALTGCEKIAQGGNRGSTGSDFYLVKLMDDIPAEWNVYFNGWSTLNEASQQGVTIHHPDGDIKKVSTYTDPLQTISWQGNGLPSHWLVYWVETQNNWGVTEGGSSGAPIFDIQGRLIGTLTGGLASCNNPTAPDYYGKFSYHWTSNGSADTARLKPWLDPDDTGTEVLDGSTMGTGEIFSAVGKKLEIFPNPVSENVSITFDASEKEPVVLRIMDAMGKQIDKIMMDHRRIAIVDVSDYPPGIYVVTGTSGGSLWIGKFSKY